MTPQEIDAIRLRVDGVNPSSPRVFRDCKDLLAQVEADALIITHLRGALARIKISAKAPGYQWGALNNDIDTALAGP
jgi:hypothetical protein